VSKIRSLYIPEKRVDDMAVKTNDRPLPSGKAFEDLADIFGGFKEPAIRTVRVAKRKGHPIAAVHGMGVDAGY